MHVTFKFKLRHSLTRNILKPVQSVVHKCCQVGGCHNFLITFVSSTVNKQQRLSTHPWSSTLVFLPRDLSAQQKCDTSRKQTISYTSDNTSTNIYEPQIKSPYWKWRQNPQLTERDVSVLRQCDSATNPCPEPDESSRHVSTTFLLNIFNPHLHACKDR